MIRIADINDAERLAKLFKELHRHHVEINPEKFRMPGDDFFRDTISEYLCSSEWITVIHESGGIPDGYAVFKLYEDDSPDTVPRRVCYVHHFAVAESSRGRGVGTELFEEIGEMARKAKCTHLRFGMNSANTGAIAFYEKMGLAPVTITMEKRI